MSGTILIMIALIIEGISCCLKHRNQYKALNTLKASGKELIEFGNDKITNLASWSKSDDYLLTITRIITPGVLTFITYQIIKRVILTKFPNSKK